MDRERKKRDAIRSIYDKKLRCIIATSWAPNVTHIGLLYVLACITNIEVRITPVSIFTLQPILLTQQTTINGLERSIQKKISRRPRTHLLSRENITSSIWVELAMYSTQERLN